MSLKRKRDGTTRSRSNKRQQLSEPRPRNVALDLTTELPLELLVKVAEHLVPSFVYRKLYGTVGLEDSRPYRYLLVNRRFCDAYRQALVNKTLFVLEPPEVLAPLHILQNEYKSKGAMGFVESVCRLPGRAALNLDVRLELKITANGTRSSRDLHLRDLLGLLLKPTFDGGADRKSQELKVTVSKTEFITEWNCLVNRFIGPGLYEWALQARWVLDIVDTEGKRALRVYFDFAFHGRGGLQQVKDEKEQSIGTINTQRDTAVQLVEDQAGLLGLKATKQP
jgi:hypothetical protein